ncbi:MAG: GWxTD domain-containing protein [bacterium]|nr:GWxTD domain-containing protein [bacterium]
MRCILAVLLFYTAPIDALKPDSIRVDSLLVVATDTTLSFKRRVRVMKEAIRYDASGRAMHALARLYMTSEDRIRWYDAEYWMQQAIARERSNPVYRTTYANLLWLLDDLDRANIQAKKALAADPENAQALYVAGRHAVWGMRRNLNTVSVAYSSDTIPLSLQEFGESQMTEAIGYLTRAMEADPGHRPARVLLGLVYYELSQPEDLVALFQEYARRYPDDSDAYFFIGLGFEAQDKLPLAYRYYMAGLRKMSESEQQFMKSIVLVADRKALSKNEEALPDEAQLREFWTSRDPLFLSPLNERLMVHCGRVAYTNLRFGDSYKRLVGWQTDKGEVFIRYGRPQSRIVRSAEYRRSRVELWEYEGFRLSFYNPISSTWKFNSARIGRIRADILKDFVDRVPEYYQDPYRWERYTVNYQISQFRGEDGKARVEVYYALPEEYVVHQPHSPGAETVDLRQGLFVFNTVWDTVYQSVVKVNLMPVVAYPATRERYLFATERVTLLPGTYYMVAEAEDRKSQAVGSFRDSVEIRKFGRDSLEVSSLLLARRIQERDEGPLGRERFMILPNPIRQYQQSGQAAFYFEVYNLFQDRFGETHYKVSYQVRALPEGDGNQVPEWVTTISYDFRGTRSWEPLYLTLGLQEMAPGRRDFRVVVEDLQSQQKAMASEGFRVMW